LHFVTRTTPSGAHTSAEAADHAKLLVLNKHRVEHTVTWRVRLDTPRHWCRGRGKTRSCWV